MRRVFLICVILLSCVSAFAGSTWHCPFYCQNTYCSIGIGSNIIACTQNNVFISTDEGNSWSDDVKGIHMDGTKAIENFNGGFHSIGRCGNNLIGLNPNGAFVSTDNGWNWELKQNWHGIRMICWGDSCLINSDMTNFLSTNRGLTWDSVPRFWFSSIIKTSYGFIACSNGRIFRSFDSGRTWQRDTSYTELYSVYELVSAGNDMLIRADDSLYKSSDEGFTWKSLELKEGVFNKIINLGVISNNWYLFCRDSVYMSSNSGESWSGVCRFPYSVFHISQIRNKCYISTEFGLVEFDPVQKQYYLLSESFRRGKLAVFKNRVVNFTSRGIDYTIDHGSTWHRIPKTDTIVGDVSINDDTVLVRTKSALLISRDACNSWATIKLNETINIGSAQFSCNQKYLSIIPQNKYNDTLNYTTDYGVTWKYCPLPSKTKSFVAYQDTIYSVFSPHNSNVLMRSTNFGQTWDLVDTVKYPERLFAFGKNLFATTKKNEIYKSTDFGMNWTVLSGVYTNMNNSHGSLNIYDLSIINGVYVLISNYGFSYSTDLGATWHTDSTGINNYTSAKTDSFTFDGTTAYLSTDNGIYYANINMLSTEDAITEPSYNQVSPNPAKDFISIPNPEFGNIYRVVNIYGETVLEQRAQSDTPMKIGVAGLQPGVYFVLSTGSQAAKFIKE